MSTAQEKRKIVEGKEEKEGDSLLLPGTDRDIIWWSSMRQTEVMGPSCIRPGVEQINETDQCSCDD